MTCKQCIELGVGTAAQYIPTIVNIQIDFYDPAWYSMDRKFDETLLEGPKSLN